MTRYRVVTTLAAIATAFLAVTAPALADDGIQGGAASSVEDAAHRIAAKTGFSGTMLGRADRPNNPRSDHPRGYAIDFMVRSNREGDRIAAFTRAHRDDLRVSYVLWQVPAHYDHVHVSFRR